MDTIWGRITSNEARGEKVDINVFVDADHEGNRVTRRSHTGIIIFLNMAPIIWFSNKQNTIETSTYASEFLALETVTDARRPNIWPCACIL